MITSYLLQYFVLITLNDPPQLLPNICEWRNCPGGWTTQPHNSHPSQILALDHGVQEVGGAWKEMKGCVSEP